MKRIVLFGCILTLGCIAMCLCTMSAVFGQGVPTEITYQGSLTDAAGDPVPDGSYSMQFAIYPTETGGTATWTSAVMSVPCAGGVFTAYLNVTKPGNVPLGSAWLEATVDSTTLPRVKLGSAPYSLHTQNLVLPFSGTASTADEAFKITNSDTGIAGLFNNSSDSNDSPALVARTSGTGNALHALNFSTTSGPAGWFEIVHPANTSSALLAITDGSGSALYGQNNGSGRGASVYITDPTNDSPCLYVSTAGTGSAVRGYTTGGSGSSGGSFEISNAANASPAVDANTTGTGRGGEFTITNSSNSQDAVYASTSGSGSAIHGYAGNANSTAGRFEVTNSSNPHAAVYATTSGIAAAVIGYTNGEAEAGYFKIDNNKNHYSALKAETNGTGYAGYFSRSADSSQPVLYAEAASVGHAVSGRQNGLGGSALFKINNSMNGYPAVTAETNGKSAALRAEHVLTGDLAVLGGNGAGVYGFSETTSGRGVTGYSTGSTGKGVYAVAEGTNATGLWASATGDSGTALHAQADGTDGTAIRARGGVNGYAAMFEGNVQLLDRDTYLPIMELGKGLDYAEGFDVSDKNGVAPGTVLVIDQDNPGLLTVSTKAYDRGVAGIVAGAGGVESGVRLGADQFDCDVALAGRVYCNVDASNGAVRPGDLLTTSPTPGYAMKVTDYERSHGAILGKAMQGLEKGGKGQILVLVALQ